jgi:hypothetical protein
VGTFGYIWVFMGMWGSMGLGNSSTCGLAFIYGGTCALVLYFHCPRWLVMNVEVVT